MSKRPSPISGAQPSDKWIPWYFVLFFVVIAGANAIFITLALDSFTGVVDENAYEHGLAYNQTIAAKRQQEALGWQADITADLTDTGRVVVSTILTDKDRHPLTGATIDVEMIRPTQENLDVSLSLAETDVPGQYRAEIPLPQQGQWDIRLHVLLDGHKYQQTKRIVLRP